MDPLPSRTTILLRGMMLRCPRCGAGSMFRGLIGLKDRCHRCGIVFERDQGFYLGATVVNYFFTAILIFIPLLVLVFTQRIDAQVALLIAIAGGIIIPLVLYRPAKSMWLALYFWIFPHELNNLDPRKDEKIQPTSRW